jgi:hypothetical protein
VDDEKVLGENVPGEKVPGEKIPEKKVPEKKVPAKKVPAKKVPAKKVPAKKVPAKKGKEEYIEMDVEDYVEDSAFEVDVDKATVNSRLPSGIDGTCLQHDRMFVLGEYGKYCLDDSWGGLSLSEEGTVLL